MGSSIARVHLGGGTTEIVETGCRPTEHSSFAYKLAALQETLCVERLRQFFDVDDAGFFLFTDAKMDVISRFEPIYQGWI
jgi:hypothetical protein